MRRIFLLLLAGLSLLVGVPAAGLPGFPEPTPIREANPDKRQERTVSMPSALNVERSADTLSISIDPKSLRPEKIAIGSGMAVGFEERVFVYPVGTERPAEAQRTGLSGSANCGTSIFSSKSHDIPKRGTACQIEVDIVFFETNIPPQHDWEPKQGIYKVLWRKTLRQIAK